MIIKEEKEQTTEEVHAAGNGALVWSEGELFMAAKSCQNIEASLLSVLSQEPSTWQFYASLESVAFWCSST